MERCAGMMRPLETNTAPAKPPRSGVPCAGCFGNPTKMPWDRVIPELLNTTTRPIFPMTARASGGCTAKKEGQFWPSPGTCNSLLVKLSKRIQKRRQAEDPGRAEKPICGGARTKATAIDLSDLTSATPHKLHPLRSRKVPVRAQLRL